MATFDQERREIVLRIVYDGAATAGKTANLRSLHATFGDRARGELCMPAETATGRTLYFDSLELRVGYLGEWPLRCQLLTVPGQLAFAERRYRLLRGIDAAVVVCESTRRGVRAARGAWTSLRGVLAANGGGPVPIVVQANKQDLPGALSLAEFSALLSLGPDQKVIAASALHGDGVRATLLAALAAARDGVRERLLSTAPEALGSPLESAEQLYDAMLREGDSEPGPAAAAALDAAIEAITMLDPRDGPPSS